jgi:hypothetical protein
MSDAQKAKNMKRKVKKSKLKEWQDEEDYKMRISQNGSSSDYYN